MSFFGFETTLPRDQRASRGVFEQHDPFAGLGDAAEADDALDFEQTYDGLGNQLNETGDTFNDDTFGSGMPATRQAGRDFDFAGETAKIRDTLMEEQTLHHARMPMQQAMQQKPKRTGYEAYKQPDYLPKLEADASIWGASVAKKPTPQAQAQQQYYAQEQQQQQQQQYHGQDMSNAAARKMMTLEEVEAVMRSQTQPQAMPPAYDMESQSQGLRAMLGVSGPPPGLSPQPQQQQQRGPPGFQRPPPQGPSPGPQPGQEYNLRAPQILQRQHSPQPPHQQQHHQQQQQQHLQHQQQQQQDFRDFQGPPQSQPMPFQQPPQPQAPMGAPPVQAAHGSRPPTAHARDPSYSGPPITQAQQMMQMSSQDREVYLAEEAKRAKRNHKIFLLSKNNGLMTPQDKNFITRIQLQQLLTATGGIDNEPGSEDQLAEDFYYQVYAQIRGPPRSGPGQPLNQFAQTYLFQTGSRYGYGRSRHHPRGGDNHVQRMEQQVARAVEAAKARPKNKSLVMEGSLGKIAFSNSKTPRPLLNIKRVESDAKPRKTVTVADRKATLRSIEKVYSTLMQTEDHERKLPPPPNEDSPPEVIEGHMRWRSEMAELNQQLWAALKVMEPIQPNHSAPHPFVQVLSHSKGKKAIPRVFRHLDEQQRLTMLTLVIIHLDVLDVVRDAYPPHDNTPIPPRVKEEVELFSQAVMPPLFSYVNEAPLNIIIGLLGLVLDRVNILAAVRTKTGISILTMLISRAELVKQSLTTSQQPTSEQQEDVAQWSELYSRLFDTVEPLLPYVFPTDTSVAAADDVYVWQFLAAMGVGASPDQQQRLVIGVKERVMETVAVSKSLPEDMSRKRLGDVNLFMRAIGLDVELLG